MFGSMPRHRFFVVALGLHCAIMLVGSMAANSSMKIIFFMFSCLFMPLCLVIIYIFLGTVFTMLMRCDIITVSIPYLLSNCIVVVAYCLQKYE